MINKTSLFINEYLKGQRIKKHEFEDLLIVVGKIKNEKKSKIYKILDWFRYLQNVEITGWRTKETTKKIVDFLNKNNERNKILFYALFCPSYKKGIGSFGFRIDDVGNTTRFGIKNLLNIYKKTDLLGFKCQKPLAIFFDLALEKPEKVINKNSLKELSINIKNLKANLPKIFEFKLLSELDESLTKKIGYEGIKEKDLRIPKEIFKRIIERGGKFYKLFGWSKQEIIERSRVIANSESLVGSFLGSNYKNNIMVYTPTMLERGAVYSGMKLKEDPLPIIYPKKE